MFQSTQTDRASETELNDAHLDQASGGIIPFIVPAIFAVAGAIALYQEAKDSK